MCRAFAFRSLALRLATILVLVAAVSCGGDSDNAEPGNTTAGSAVDAEESGTPTAGGALTVITLFQPISFDPVALTNAGPRDGNMATAVYDVLVDVGLDGTVTPKLAESVESADFVDWEITFREGVLFSDGTPFDAEAVVYNWDRHTSGDLPSGCAAAFIDVESYRAADGLTVEVTLAAPDSQFAGRLMECMGLIGSPSAIEEMGEEFGLRPVGAGPFVVREWARDSELRLERNPDYWDAPRPYLDEFTVRFIPDVAAMYNAFVSGQGDVLTIPFAVPQIQQLRDAGDDVRSTDLAGAVGLGFNVTRAPFDDLRMRQAIAYALDIPDLADKASAGIAIPADTLIPEAHPLYSDPAPVIPTNDLDRAQELFDAYVAEHGPVSVSMLTSEANAPWFQAAQQQISRLSGITAVVDSQPAAGLVEKQRNKDFDMTLGSWASDDPGKKLTQAFMTGGQWNLWGYSNPDMDALLQEGRSTDDAEKRREVYSDVSELWAADIPTIGFWRLEVYTAVAEEVKGLELVNDGRYHAATIWIDE